MSKFAYDACLQEDEDSAILTCGCQLGYTVMETAAMKFCPLHAAAADLRGALTEMMRQFESADPGADDGVSDCDAIVLARFAIAKTKGE